MQAQTAKQRRDWIWILGVILVSALALGLRWYYVTTAQVIDPVRTDAAQYVHYAWNLAHRHIFSDSSPGVIQAIPTSYRDPGYPLLLALWMKVFSNQDLWYASVLLTQALLSALTVTLTVLLGRHWLNRGWALVAGLLLAVWPHNIVIASNLLSETLFGFLCTLAVWLCARACGRGTVGGSIAAGIAFGAAALTNAMLVPFGILLALYLAWRRLVPRRVWFALCLSAIVLPGVWAIRNHFLPASAAGQTSGGRALENLVQGSWPDYHSAYRAVAFHRSAQGETILHAIGAEVRLTQASPLTGFAAIVHRVREAPLQYLIWYAIHKPWELWNWNIRMGQGDIYQYFAINSPFITRTPMRALEAMCFTINPLLAVLMLGSVVTVLLPRKFTATVLPHGAAALHATMLVALFATVVYSIFQSEPRYSIPFRPFEMLLAVTVCSMLATWGANVRRRADQQPGPPPVAG